MRKQVFSIVEFAILFFGIPLLILSDRDFIHPSMIVLPALVFIFIVLHRTSDFTFRELFRWRIPRNLLIRNGIVVAVCGLFMLVYVLLFERENMFNLIRANPWIFVGMCLFYPVFSAFGQEIIYRTFLYKRYRGLFSEDWQFVLASGITFSFVHIVYYDPISMILTFVGGLYFARVYLQTKSVLFSAVLHGLLGMMVFGIGLGQYFWLDIPI